MEYEISFIKWKWLITKSINDLVIWAWFEIPVLLYETLHKYINHVLILKIELDWQSIELNCNVCRDTKTYLQFVDDHWIVRLDIIFPNILLAWYILKWKIKLIIN